MQNNLQSLLENVLSEGGASGHMKHPYEVYTDPKELLTFFKKFFEGEYAGSEKVDGVNIWFGYNNNGNLVFLRNKNEGPIERISDKFSIRHGAYTVFNAGWKALKSAFSKLSDSDKIKYNLISVDGKSKNFISAEILFGYIPNIIPYSKDTNFIVFHNFEGTEENGWEAVDNDGYKKTLKNLASRLGTIAIEASKIEYSGTVNKVKMIAKPMQTFWKFQGPQEITKEKIKEMLSSLVDKWEQLPEVKRLKEFITTGGNEEEKFNLMKQATKAIGKLVIYSEKSRLATEKPIDRPGVEGYALDVDGNKIKITGDYLDFNKPSDIKTFDATLLLRTYIQKDVLGLSTTTMKAAGDVEEYVMNNKSKKYHYKLDTILSEEGGWKSVSVEANKRDIKLTQPSMYIKDNIITLINVTKAMAKEALKMIKSKGREYDEKSLLSQLFDINRFEKELKSVKTYRELIKSYAKNFFRK